MSVYAMNNTGPWYNERLKDKQDKEWSIFKKNELEKRDVTQDRTRLNWASATRRWTIVNSTDKTMTDRYWCGLKNWTDKMNDRSI